ncbi:MAG: outer membrane beta-barrel protein [Coraliomargaritaceae bacterium]
MKNKIAIASAFVAASSLATAEIVINDFLSFEGFVDMSYTHTDIDSDDSAAPGSDNGFGVDQVEINWLFNFDKVSGVVDFAYTGSDASGTAVNSGDDTQLEQAYATYALDEASSITAGRFQSMLGFEAFEPTGLYQFSFAYDNSILPAYGEGVKYNYASGDFAFGAALLSGYESYDFGRLGGSGDSSNAIELAVSYSQDSLSFFLGAAQQDSEGATDGNTTAINAYVTYETGAWLFAGELNSGNSETGAYGAFGDDVDALSGLLMANYAYSDAASVTARVSFESFEGNDAISTEVNQTKLTLAHGYAFTDNLFLVTEVSVVENTVETDNAADVDTDSLAGAVELIFAF